MTCPKCGKETKVKKTIKLDHPSQVIRFRKCDFCGADYTTKESFSDITDQSKTASKDCQSR